MKTTVAVIALPLLIWGGLRFADAAGTFAAEEPICVVTHVDVIPPFTAQGRDLLRQFAENTRKDSGVVRVDVFEELARPNHSTVVEVWESRKAYDDHLATDATRAYRTRLQPMLGSPFDERLHRVNKP